MKGVTVVDHPLVQHKLTLMRRKDTSTKSFRQLLKEIGSLICYQILSGDVTDHLPEYATMKAMGYPNRTLAWVVIQEALILALVGYAVGMAISWLAYLGLSDATGMPLRMSFGRAATVFIATVGMCILSGLIALVRLLRADPADVFA